MKIVLNFKRLSVPALLLFLKKVIGTMKGMPRYAAESKQVDVVDAAYLEFDTAAADAVGGGKVKVELRNQKSAKVLAEMDTLVRLMELHTDEDVTFFTEPGFSVQKTPVRHDGDLTKPVIKFLRQGVLENTADGEVTAYPVSVNQLAIRCSEDNGLNWKNGTYSAGKRFTIPNLETRKEYLVEACFHGTHGRMSDWSTSMKVFLK